MPIGGVQAARALDVKAKSVAANTQRRSDRVVMILQSIFFNGAAELGAQRLMGAGLSCIAYKPPRLRSVASEVPAARKEEQGAKSSPTFTSTDEAA